MEKQIIPQDILDRADELYPSPNVSDFDNYIEFGDAVTYYVNHIYPVKQAYIDTENGKIVKSYTETDMRECWFQAIYNHEAMALTCGEWLERYESDKKDQ